MIYWPITADEFDLYIPNASGYAPQESDPRPVLTVRSNVGLELEDAEMEFDTVTPLYFFQRWTNWEVGLVPGEYTYRLTLGAEGRVLSEGILVVGDYKPADCIQYDKPTTYEQYQPE